eukprot:354275-Pyramimonas_sp.AAC.2
MDVVKAMKEYKKRASAALMEEYPALTDGWARCKHHDEQLRPRAPRPCRHVAATEYGSADIRCHSSPPLGAPKSASTKITWFYGSSVPPVQINEPSANIDG